VRISLGRSDKQTMKTRIIGTVAVGVAAALASVTVPSPASAATVTCNPVNYRFAVREGALPITIGVVTVVKNACVTNGRKGLSSSHGKLKWAASGIGSTAGWKWLGTSTQLLSRGATMASYKSMGGLQLCVPFQVSPLCAEEETFSVTYDAYGPQFVGPPALPHFACVSKGCHLHFAYAGLG
jgi:hypothetical protein